MVPPDQQHALVLEHLPLLAGVAYDARVAYLRGPVADQEDFWAAGATGMVTAVRRYDPSIGAFAPLASVAARHEMRREAIRVRWRKRAAERPDRVRVNLSAPGAGAGEVDALVELIPDPHVVPPDVQVEAAERAADVRAAVAKLSRDRRDVIVAYYFLGEDQATIAARLGITQPAVSLRLTTARRALARALHQYAPPRRVTSTASDVVDATAMPAGPLEDTTPAWTATVSAPPPPTKVDAGELARLEALALLPDADRDLLRAADTFHLEVAAALLRLTPEQVRPRLPIARRRWQAACRARGLPPSVRGVSEGVA